MKRLLVLFFLVTISFYSYSQNDCIGTMTFTVSVPPQGGYLPGTVVTYCVTADDWDTGIGGNWMEGFNISLGPGWLPGSITPITTPTLVGTTGQWIWVGNTFTNPTPANGGGPANFGPGFFVDYNNDGTTVDDWGDFGTGPWTICFSVIVGNNVGASLSLGVSAVSDGYAGSYTQPGCDGLYPLDVSPVTDVVLGCAIGNVVAQQNVNCFGQANASFTVGASSGVAPYTFTLNGITNSTGNFTNLTAQTYAVVITDATACTSTFNVIVTEPTELEITVPVVTNLTCNGNNSGEVSTTASGGTTPHTYNLNFFTNTTGTFTNLPANNYILNVVDANGCVVSDLLPVTEPSAIIPSLTSIDSMLCSNDLEANFSISAVGGNLPYTYSSIPFALNASGNFVATTGGIYNVTVTDASSCTSTIFVNVFQVPVPFNIIVDTVKQMRCFGDNNGEIIIIPVGGLPPYTFTCAQNSSLNNSTGQFTNLGPGQYTITCKDSYGCSFTVDETIIEINAPLSATIISQSPVICFGDSTGRLTVLATGGTAPYDFANCCLNINTNPAFFVDVFAGADTVLVVDANGCFVKIPYVMVGPANPLTLDTLFFQNVLCLPSQDGTISLDVTGGWPINGIVYNFDLYEQQPDATYSNILSNQTGVFGNLGEGAYYVVVTDELGCSDSLVYDITSPDFEVSGNVIVHTDNICYGGNTGRIFFEATGGLPPYSYFVNGVPSSTTDLLNLTAGSYSITIVDENGCQFNILESITEPPFYQLNFTTIGEVDCFGDCTGTVQLNAIGGTPGYVYSIDGFTANNTGLFTNLCGGTFTATVTDTMGCVYTSSSSVNQPAAPLDALELVNQSVTCFGGNDGEFYIQAVGGTANYSYTILGQTTAITQTNNFGVFLNLPADDYDVTITDSNNCIKLQTVTIAQPSNPLQLTVSDITAVKCYGDTTGRICFDLSGGTAPYNYSCSDNVLVQPEGNLGNNNTCYWGLNAGVYTILITDANGCTITTQGTVTQPAAALTASATLNNVSCFGGSNGTAAISANGGTGAYSYAINTNMFAYNSIFVYNNLSAGEYEVIVRDDNLCTVSVPFSITQPNLPLASDVLNVVPLKCNGDSTACVTVAAISTTGSMPYTYTYNGVTNTTGLFCNFAAGNYSIVVTDANNCTIVQPINVPNPPQIEAGFDYVRNVSCFGGNDGVLGAFATGGTPGLSPNYYYQWLGLTVQADSATGLSATTYCVVVKDSLGCVDTACATLTEPEKLLTIGVGITDICIGDSTVLTVNATGGTPNYTFNWYPNGITQTPPLQGTPITVDPSTTTYYLVDVTDARNCTSQRDTLNVVVHPLPTAAFVIDKPIGCEGMCAQFRDISLISSTTNDVLTNWYWYYGDNTFESVFNPSHCYSNAGSYTVRMIVQTNYGCKDTVMVPNAILTHPNPNPEFSYGPQPTTLLEPEVSFSPVLVEGNLYKWDFGDGANSNQISPVHLYGDTGTYCVTLTQTSINGCIDSTINCVRIDPDITLYVPKAFSPNGDDINDNFYAIGQYVADYSIEVYDRWGKSVFAGIKMADKWDGKLNGSELAQGTYTWYIKATDSLGKKIRKTGTVTLIR
jgi:gliding motility-associated-like protein